MYVLHDALVRVEVRNSILVKRVPGNKIREKDFFFCTIMARVFTTVRILLQY